MAARKPPKKTLNDGQGRHGLGWKHVVGFSVPAVLLSMVLGLGARPARRLLEQAGVAGSAAVDWAGIRRQVGERLRRSAPGALRFWGQRSAPVEGNGFYAYRQAGAKLAAPDRPADPATAFAAINPLLEQGAAAPRCTVYDAEELAAWLAELDRSAPRRSMAGFTAVQQVVMRRANMPALTGGRLVRLGHELAAANLLESADRCFDAARDLSARVLAAARTASVIRACARTLAEAFDGKSHVAAGRGDWAQARRSGRAADSARRFLALYRQRLTNEPADYLAGGRPIVLRRTSYLAASTTLLAVGAFGVGVLGGIVVFVASLIILAAERLVASPPSRAKRPTLSGLGPWIGLMGAVWVGPAAGAGLFLLVPIDPDQLWATGWLGPVFRLIAFVTMAAILVAANRITPAADGDNGRTWWLAGLGMACVLFVILFPQWQIFGGHEAWFDGSLALDRRITNTQSVLWGCAVIVVLAGVVSIVKTVVARRGQRSTAKEAQASRSAERRTYWRTVAGAAALAWLLSAGCGLLASRTFHHLERRHAALIQGDVADEVTARMGPAWRSAFFADATAR